MRSARSPLVVRDALAALLLLAAPAAAQPSGAAAGADDVVRIEVEFFEGDDPSPVNRATVFTSQRRVRVEQRGADPANPPPVFVYRGDQDRLYSIVDPARTYVMLERAMLDRLGAGPRLARSEIDRQLEGVPRDQQRLYGHLLGTSSLDPSKPEDPLVVARTGELDTASGFPCRRATISRSGRLLARGCIADWDVVGLAPADADAFRSLALLARDAMASRSPVPKELVPGQPLDLIVQLGGMPIHFERAGDFPGASSVRVTSVERMPAQDALFEVPAGYTARTGLTGLAGFASLLSRPARAAAPAAVAPSETAPAAMDPGFDAEPADDRDEAVVVQRAPTPASRWMPRPYRSISLFGDP